MCTFAPEKVTFYDTQKDMLLSTIHSDYGPVM